MWDAPTHPWNPTSEFSGENPKELPAHKIPSHFHIAVNRRKSVLSVVSDYHYGAIIYLFILVWRCFKTEQILSQISAPGLTLIFIDKMQSKF